MYFGLSEEQESIQDFVKKFLADNSTVDEIRKIANGEGEELEKNIFEGILSLGINTLLIPEKHNGLGAGLFACGGSGTSFGVWSWSNSFCWIICYGSNCN